MGNFSNGFNVYSLKEKVRRKVTILRNNLAVNNIIRTSRSGEVILFRTVRVGTRYGSNVSHKPCLSAEGRNVSLNLYGVEKQVCT